LALEWHGAGKRVAAACLYDAGILADYGTD